MSRRACSSPIAAALCTLLLLLPGAGAAPACEDEGPGLVAVSVEATLSPEDAENIVVETYEGTLVIKGIVMRGTATWREVEEVLAEGPVTVAAMILTTGDPAAFLENRGILWLKYAFRDPVTDEATGSGDGFVTLERVADLEGAASFQGAVAIGGVERQFAGTGWTGVRGLIPDDLLRLSGEARLGCDEEEDGISQQMDQTVITGAKPGFEFENTRTPRQLNRQFHGAVRRLTGERNERLRILNNAR